MDEKINFLTQQHASISALALHYNQINWSLHTIFVPLQIAIGFGLGSQIFVSNFSSYWSTLFFIAISAGSGMAILYQWWKIYKRHRGMIHTLYTEIHKLEGDITTASSVLGHPFAVHKLLDDYDKAILSARKTIYGTHSAIRVLFVIFLLMYITLFGVCLSKVVLP